VTAIPLRRRLPGAWCDLPGRRDPDIDPRPSAVAAAAGAVPIRSCSRWGLPCHRRCRRRGALLPHRFTLAAPLSRAEVAVFSLWHFPWAWRPPDVIRHRMSMEPGLSSRDRLSASARAAVRPT